MHNILQRLLILFLVNSGTAAIYSYMIAVPLSLTFSATISITNTNKFYHAFSVGHYSALCELNVVEKRRVKIVLDNSNNLVKSRKQTTQ
jgi:hypothetical protein